MKKRILCVALIALMLCLCGCDGLLQSLGQTRVPEQSATVRPNYTEPSANGTGELSGTTDTDSDVSLDEQWRHLGLIPEFTDKPYHVINDNKPFFTAEDITAESYESYPELDELGRCTAVMACIGFDLMPTEDRGEIGQVKPTGWHTVKYDCVNGKYLYNRCHLIGFQLTGENANERNLITGTRYMNVDGMLPFENMVADYLKEERDNHVLYRVTPIFLGDNLVAHGVLMEAYSVEDEGEGICFNVFCYNAQPQITIDYKTGESRLSSDQPSAPVITPAPATTDQAVEVQKYILNTKTHKIHKEDCSSVKDIKEENKAEFTGDIKELENDGYSPCKSCNP